MNAFLTILGVVISAMTALSIAYMHRKQMRQVEAYKNDPSLPLKPPPHPFLAWCRNHSLLFIALIWVMDLALYLSRPPAQLTVRHVFQIALDVNMLFLLVIVDQFMTFLRSMITTFKSVSKVLAK